MRENAYLYQLPFISTFQQDYSLCIDQRVPDLAQLGQIKVRLGGNACELGRYTFQSSYSGDNNYKPVRAKMDFNCSWVAGVAGLQDSQTFCILSPVFKAQFSWKRPRAWDNVIANGCNGPHESVKEAHSCRPICKYTWNSPSSTTAEEVSWKISAQKLRMARIADANRGA